MVVDAVAMIRTARRQTGPYDETELKEFILRYAQSEIPDYQMSAWLMAVAIQGISKPETAVLTSAIVESGVRLDWKEGLPLVDKHSTGGVGDKVSLILAPLVAAMGLQVPMMAGRGLGHTGGTIDKLAAIPGMNVDLGISDFQRVCYETGVVISSATTELCPADRKLYALRDVTDTVSSVPLQTASIMSKKIAENPCFLVLDVKYGVGAFQETLEAAIPLAESMVETGHGNGIPTVALLTRMDAPLGEAIGNWVEVKECIDIMNGKWNRTRQGPLIDVTVMLAGEMLHAVHPEESIDVLTQKAYATLKAGKAMAKFRDMVQAQGGDVSVIDASDDYPKAKFVGQAVARSSGYIESIHALTVGTISVHLGAGRSQVTDPVDAQAGIVFAKHVGDHVEEGENIATLYTNRSETLDAAIEKLSSCVGISSSPVSVPPIVSHRTTRANGVEAVTIPKMES